mgnify:CR=1 FL=1
MQRAKGDAREAGKRAGLGREGWVAALGRRAGEEQGRWLSSGGAMEVLVCG